MRIIPTHQMIRLLHETPDFSDHFVADMLARNMHRVTRSRVNVFMNTFKKLGYIEYSGGLQVKDSLVTVISRDDRVGTRPSKTG